MLKRVFCLVVTMLMLLPLLPAVASGSDAEMLSYDELCQWVESYKLRAMDSQLLNDPAQPEYATEDGYMLVYDFATFYMDRPEMSEDSRVKSLVINDYETDGPRGVNVDYTVQEVLDAFYSENDGLAGNAGEALLYAVDMMPDSAFIAQVHRDGQRLQTVEYTVHEQLSSGGDGYTSAGLVFTIQAGNVAAIRAWGLDNRVDEADVLDALDKAMVLGEEASYSHVTTSYVGTDLPAFNLEDLMFAGLDFATLTPEMAQAALGNALQDLWLDNDGGYIRVMEFADCEIIFLYDENKQHAVVDSMSIISDSFEGPRSVRLGDQLSGVLNRFRHSEGEYDELTGVEALYGTEGAGSYGTAAYGTDASATLRYGVELTDGRQAVLYLYFEQLTLREILLYMN